jgi:hypothetical protein
MSPDLAPGNIRSRTVGKRVPDKEVLERLANAQEIYRREDFQDISARGFNVNATITSAK